MSTMSKDKASKPKIFINRELSWLEFNNRVLAGGNREDFPLLERLKFLAITGSNLDEAFMIRVAGLMHQKASGVRRRDPSGMTPSQQLTEFLRKSRRMMEAHAESIGEVTTALAEKGIRILDRDDWSQTQHQYLRNYFQSEILPVLTPMAVEELDPCPLLSGLQLYVGAEIESMADTSDVEKELEPTESELAEPQLAEPQLTKRIIVVPVPERFSRFVPLHAVERLEFCRLEDVIAANLDQLFPGCRTVSTDLFRITRDADVSIDDDEAGDLLQSVEEAVHQRRRRAAVRLEISARPNLRLKRWLSDFLNLRPESIFEIEGMLNATSLWEIVNLSGFDHLKWPQWSPQPPRDLIGVEDIWQTLQNREMLLFHPYESFEPVVQLVEAAAIDPDVLSIKQTLYRTSGDSPIVSALERAAHEGKEVTVLVELKARFDEHRNVTWARRLEDAGCHVIYGIAGLKTHAKALLIVRREPRGIRRYIHLGTGNYNDRTARVYSDIGLISADSDLAADVAAFFNLLTGFSEMVGWSKMAVAPTGLRNRFLELIDREIELATPDQPGLIMAKMNSLEDPEICRALARASENNVEIKLNVRGICCLRPGLKGQTSNITITSFVDRFLEHARIYYFRNAGREELYLSSADWMRRNLSRRLELLFPVSAPKLRRRVLDYLKICLADNVCAFSLDADGTYHQVERTGRKVHAQEVLYQKAKAAARNAEVAPTQFRPLKRPKNL
jgi:polyphosphate kinase